MIQPDRRPLQSHWSGSFFGPNTAREARRNGVVPGVIYGGNKDSIAIGIKYNEVLKAINSGQFLSNMVELNHDGKSQKAITKDVQFHPVTDAPIHVDFFRVTEKTIIDVDVAAVFVGEDQSPVDISGLEIGDAIHLSEVTLPPNVTPGITDRDVTIATIVASRTSKTEDEEAEGEGEGEGEEAAEGEAAAPEAEG